MTATLEFELVSPLKLLVSDKVDMVIVPGVEGDLGVLPGHSPLITNVRPGVISILDGDDIKQKLFVTGGFCEIKPDLCTVLSAEAIKLEDIDSEIAQKRYKDAEEAEASANDENKAEALRELKIASAMVEAISG